MSLDHIRLSEHARDQLVRLKRYTGIKNWNVLCRWALCKSLAERSSPALAHIPADSSVEMTWKTFAGAHSEVYLALLKQRCIEEGIEPTDSALHEVLRQHIHRGISYLAGERDLRSITQLLRRAAEPIASNAA